MNKDKKMRTTVNIIFPIEVVKRLRQLAHEQRQPYLDLIRAALYERYPDLGQLDVYYQQRQERLAEADSKTRVKQKRRQYTAKRKT